MTVPVVLYVPNLIGYTRIILGIAAFAFVRSPMVFIALYFTSQGLDAVDGVCARMCNQTSNFGAVLDMVTDRFCTSLLLMVVGQLFEEQNGMPIAAALVALDFISHWYAMYADLSSGGSSHKDMRADDTPWILKLYYSQLVLFLVCSLNEFCLLLMYASAQGEMVRLPQLSVGGTDVTALVEAAVPQLARSTNPAVPAGVREALGWLLVAAVPVFVFKQTTSLVQLVWAAGRVAASDARSKRKTD